MFKFLMAGAAASALFAAPAMAQDSYMADEEAPFSGAYVGGSFKLKRFAARAKGRGVRVEKKWSNLTVVVREQAEAAEETK